MSEMQKVIPAPNSSGVKWVTEQEIEALRVGAKATRNPVRNELIVLMLYRHGLRESELCEIQLEAINLDEAKIFVKRVKNGNDFMHPIASDELRLIRRYLRLRNEKKRRIICLGCSSLSRGQVFAGIASTKLLLPATRKQGLGKLPLTCLGMVAVML